MLASHRHCWRLRSGAVHAKCSCKCRQRGAGAASPGPGARAGMTYFLGRGGAGWGWSAYSHGIYSRRPAPAHYNIQPAVCPVCKIPKYIPAHKTLNIRKKNLLYNAAI